MGAIPNGYTAGPWIDSDPGVVTSPTSTSFNSYKTEVTYDQAISGIDPNIDLRAVLCSWEGARAGDDHGTQSFSYWGKSISPPYDYTCSPVNLPGGSGDGFTIGSQNWAGDSISYEGFFGATLDTSINTLTFSVQPIQYVQSTWYLTNPTGIVIPSGATLDWDGTAAATVTNVDVTFTATAATNGPGCNVNVSPVHGGNDLQFRTATTSGHSFILPGVGGTAGTCAPGGSVTISAAGNQLVANQGTIVIRSSFVDDDVPPTTTTSANITIARACFMSAHMTITAIPPRHRFLYPTATIPSVVTSPPVTGFTVTSGNWYQDDGLADLNVVGDGRPLRFYSSTDSSDSITVHFGPIDLGPNPTIGFADVYVVGSGIVPLTLPLPPLSLPITVYAADSSVIQTIAGGVDTNEYASWFTLNPDVRLAGGCSITFTVPPQGHEPFETYNEFWISAVILELRSTQAINTLSLQQGSGLGRFDNVVAMR